MKHLNTAHQGCPIAKLRFHPEKRLPASFAGPRADFDGGRAALDVHWRD